MKIAVVLPNLRGGGAERVSVNLANAFVKRGLAVDMVLVKAIGELLDGLHPEVRVVDLRATRLRAALLPLFRYLRRDRPAAVLACMWPLTVIALWARSLARVKTRIVVAEHTTWSRSPLLDRWTVGWQVRKTMEYFFPRAEGIVAVSRGVADDLGRFANLERSAIAVIYNPVVGGAPVLAPAVLPPEGWWKGPHRRVLAVGALKDQKDYSTLLEAMEMLRFMADAKLLILGEGSLRAKLEGQIQQLGLRGTVFMPGFVKDPSPYYQHADLHVLSSACEGFGNVIVEALAAGTPVVSTDCPSGPHEILDDGRFGRLVPVGNAAALAEAMAEALAAEHNSAALKARAQHFSIDRAAEQYLQLLVPGWTASGAR